MKTIKAKIKNDLKQISGLIRTLKATRKSQPNGFVAGLHAQRVEYRHKHVVRCLLRGKTLEQIEPKVSKANPRNELMIHRYWLEYTGEHYPKLPPVAEVAHEAPLCASAP